MKGTIAAIAFAAFQLPFGAAAADGSLAVTGLVAHPLHLSLTDLRALSATHVSATQTSGKGPVALDCEGPSVLALLARAVPAFGEDKNANLSHVLLFTADDGYRVALSMGEIDPDYGHAAAIIALTCDGKPLDAPRLVVPGDVHAGRAVRGLVAIEVK